MAHGKMGPKGPKSSVAGKKGTNHPAKAPKGSSGAKGGRMTGRLTPPHSSIQRGKMGSK